ncbi:uncharacterized protein LOC131147243 [Malania oleifera]|uniref:uncharacterized protein LOC131147243 n=1 Tax=Malania oleifera TaxID=397392 RepID=UPI0025AE15FF|nr:uncharacterized protein LOC131147243 [Malania oleifera]
MRFAEEAVDLQKQSEKVRNNMVSSPGLNASDETIVAAADAEPVSDLSDQVATAMLYLAEVGELTGGYLSPPSYTGAAPLISSICSAIIPAKCRYDVSFTKVEIRITKAEAINWTSLEFCKENSVTERINVASDLVAWTFYKHIEHILEGEFRRNGKGTNRPAYPTSKLRSVDWDKLEAQVKKEEKDEKLDGDAALNKFFRDIKWWTTEVMVASETKRTEALDLGAQWNST